MNEKVYLDYAATTPVDVRVVNAMLPYFSEIFGNPSSVHFFGQRAEDALENARRTVAGQLNAHPDEIFFTSCGTESDNLALRGTTLQQMMRKGAKHILVSPVEHHAVLHTVQQLAEEHGFTIQMLAVDSFGMVTAETVRASLRKDTALVSVIYANNEIGTINPIAEIGAVCKAAGVPLHSDAVQAAAHFVMDVERDQVDLLAIGAHKFYGPKGVGALYIRPGTPIQAVQTGGKQENGLRAGTQNIPLIVGLAEALKITHENLAAQSPRLTLLRDTLIQGVLETIPGAQLTGHPTQRLPNHASFVFDGVDGNFLLAVLDANGFACSSGSACKVGDPTPSEVLTAIGLSKSLALGSLRVTLGRSTTPEEIQSFLAVLPAAVSKSRRS